MIKRIINFLLSPYKRFKEDRQFKKRLEELRKRDPFIYK
jgi:hypothetical protein